jgi:hypothetical protein
MVTDAASWWARRMLQANKTGVWSGTYEITLDGRPLTTWTRLAMGTGGSFDLDGRRFEVHIDHWSGCFSLSTEDGEQVATTGRVGHTRWNMQADGHRYEFERTSAWSDEQALLDGDGQRVGSIRRVSPWRADAEVDLPGVPLHVQVFALVAVLATWEAQWASSSV